MKKTFSDPEVNWGPYRSLFAMFDGAGVPHETRWRSFLLYLREIKDYTHLTDSQKVAAQKLLQKVIETRLFTGEQLHAVLEEYHGLIMAPQKQKNEELLRETAGIISGFQDLLTRRCGAVSELEETTISCIGQDMDQSVLIDKLKTSFQKVKGLLEKDINSLEAMATHDSLSGLANRRAFDDFIEKGVGLWLREKRPLGLALFDIDHFKRFNDKYGHRVGDQVILTVAEELKKVLPSFGVENAVQAARYGGEEFALVVSGPGALKLASVAEAIRRTISKSTFMIRNTNGSVLGTGLSITISAGVALIWEGWNGAYAENLIDSADKALYHAKLSGRNKTACCRHSEDQGCLLSLYDEKR